MIIVFLHLENELKPESFAEILCEDLKLPHTFIPLISSEIKSQVQENFTHFPSKCLPWTSAQGNPTDNGSKDDQELRILIKLDITLSNYSLVDQFEWDIMCKRNDPELFAEHLVRELGLDCEFISAIAHSIREQVQSFASSLLLLDYGFDGSPITNEGLSSVIMPPVNHSNILRPVNDMDTYGPKYIMASSISDKMERDAKRDARRKRRQTQRSRRSILTVPDKMEPQKTIRTPIGLYNNAIVALNAGFVQSGSKPIELHPDLAEQYKTYVQKEDQKHELIRIRTLPHSKPEKEIWRCLGCQKTELETKILRVGPDGLKSLCNQCGLYFVRYGEVPNGTNSSFYKKFVAYPSLYINNIKYINRLIQNRYEILKLTIKRSKHFDNS